MEGGSNFPKIGSDIPKGDKGRVPKRVEGYHIHKNRKDRTFVEILFTVNGLGTVPNFMGMVL